MNTEYTTDQLLRKIREHTLKKELDFVVYFSDILIKSLQKDPALRILEFSSNLNLDNGVTSRSLGQFYNRMEWIPENNYIIWNYGKESWSEDETVIGIYLENNTLVDYDGVFELPEQAMILLRTNGVVVPEDFYAEDWALSLT